MEREDLEDEYAPFAEIYDIFYRKTDDLEFYASMAKRFGEPVLELGCGTGRVLLHLAKKGFKITGLDSSRSMLGILEKKLRELPSDVRDRVEVVHGDMRNFKLDKMFKLIIIPFSTIVSNLSLEDGLKTFKNCYNHLENGGALVFDVFIPNFEYLSKRERRFFDIRELDDGYLILWEVANYDLTNQLIDVKRYVKILKKNSSREVVWSFRIRYWFKTELELLLKIAGFEKIEVFSGYNLEPYDYDKNPMIFIAKKLVKSF